jgi:hypothetical protein
VDRRDTIKSFSLDEALQENSSFAFVLLEGEAAVASELER